MAEKKTSPVEKILFEVFGYGKIDSLLKGERREGQYLQEHLGETLFSTTIKKIPWVSKIKRIEELEGEELFTNLEGSRLSLYQNNYSHFLENGVLLRRGYLPIRKKYNQEDIKAHVFWTKKNLESFVEKEFKRILPGSKMELTEFPYNFLIQLVSDDLALEISGSNPAQNGRHLKMAFNIYQGDVDKINKIVTKFGGFVGSSNKRYKPKEEFLDPQKLRNMSQDEALNLLGNQSGIKKYDPEKRYKEGTVINHPDYGLGLIMNEVAGKTFTIFPKNPNKVYLE